MKKIVVLIILAAFIASCAPRRARCYGKRCVENTKVKSKESNQRNS